MHLLRMMLQILLMSVYLLMPKKDYDYVPSVEEYESPHDFQPQEVKFTYYIWTGNHTASGVYPTIGMVASNNEHLGDIAMLYTADKEFIGYFECTDTGGTQGLKKGKVIDIYAHDMTTVYKFADEYGTNGYVLWIEADG